MIHHLSRNRRLVIFVHLMIVVLAACTSGSTNGDTAGAGSSGEATNDSELVTQSSVTRPPPTPTIQPTAEPIPADTPEAKLPTGTPEPAVEVDPTEEPTPTEEPEPTVAYYEIIPLGSVADFSASEDSVGIEGIVEVIELNKIRITDFVFLAEEAPGVDIRLGIDGDFSDEIAYSLKDITGKTYEGRSLTLTIPARIFDGRTYNSIAIYCYVAPAEIFDWVSFEAP